MSDSEQKKSEGKPARTRKAEQRNRKAERRAAKANQSQAVVAAPEPPAVPEAAFALADAPIEQMVFVEAAAVAPDPEPVDAHDIATAPAEQHAETVAVVPPEMSAEPEPAMEQAETAETGKTLTTLPAPVTPVSLFALAQAYGDYTRKSYEQTRSFFDKMTGVRSLDKAVEVQAEFAREAFDTFVTEAEKIRRMHRDLAMQRFRRIEGLMSGNGR